MTDSIRLTYDQALEAALLEEMQQDERIIVMSTNPPKSLSDAFGHQRVRRAPIAESAMAGMAVGAAGSGLRPVVLFGNVSFSFVAFDQLVNQAARIHYMFGGQRNFPIVFRARYLNGTRSAAQHSQTGYALFAHAAGLKIAVPSNAADAKGLLKAAIRDDNPVYLFEAERLAGLEDDVSTDRESVVNLGEAARRRHGDDITIVAIGYMVEVALAAGRALSERGVSADIIDPRTLVPLDIDAIRASVQRTGRLVLVDESFPTCSIASEIATGIVEHGPSMRALKAPIHRVCTAHVPVPFSPSLEDYVLPSEAQVVNAALAAMDGD